MLFAYIWQVIQKTLQMVDAPLNNRANGRGLSLGQ
jgi:hypothetical protein